MALSPVERTAVSQQIQALLNENVKRPFAILRECGQVAELRQRLASCTELGGVANATLAKRKDTVHQVAVNRIQLEIEATTELLPEPTDPTIFKKIDLVVLSSHPTLHYARGRGDVIKRLAPTSLAAAIEIKASPSSDKSAGGEYVKDIAAMLWLASEYDVSTYFVLFDKSDGFYSEPSCNGEGRWWKDERDAFTLRYRRGELDGDRRDVCIRTCAKHLGIEFKSECPKDVKYVEVWLTRPREDGEWSAQCFFATLEGHRTNLYVNPARALEEAAAYDSCDEAAADMRGFRRTAPARGR